jgi:hypothetical protein
VVSAPKVVTTKVATPQRTAMKFMNFDSDAGFLENLM